MDHRGRRTSWAAAAILGCVFLAVLIVPRGESAALEPAASTTLPSAEPPALPAPAASPAAPTPLAAPAVPPPTEPAEPVDTTRFTGLGAPLLVDGRIVDEHGAPIAGADVHFLPRGELLEAVGFDVGRSFSSAGLVPRSSPGLVRDVELGDLPHTRTDADGRFRIAGRDTMERRDGDLHRPPELPQLVVSAAGHATRVVRLLPIRRDTISLEETALVPASRLSGRVVDATGVPVPGVFVRAPYLDAPSSPSPAYWYHPQAFLEALHTATTDHDGRFEIDALWPGEYAFHFEHPRFAVRALDPVLLEPGRATDLGDVTLSVGEPIQGRVVDARGDGVPHATVFATRYVRSFRTSGCFMFEFEEGDDRLPHELAVRWLTGTRATVSDAYGEFELHTAPGESRTLYAQAHGFGAVRGPELSGSQRFVELRLPDEAVLDVILEFPRGAPPPADIRLTAERLTGEHQPSVALQVRELPGRGFRVHDVGPLGTRLQLEAPGMAIVSQEEAGQAPGTRRETRLVIAPEASVSGRLLDIGGERPASGTQVFAIQAGHAFRISDEHITVTDADGRFRIGRMAAGRWTLFHRGGFSASYSFELATAEQLDGVEFELEQREGRAR